MDGKYFELFDSARVWADACVSYEEVLRWTFGRGSWRVLGVRNGFLSAIDSDGRVERRPVWEIPEYATRLNSKEDFADSVVEEERLDFYRQLHEISFEGVLCAFLVGKDDGRFVDVVKISSGSLVDLCDLTPEFKDCYWGIRKETTDLWRSVVDGGGRKNYVARELLPGFEFDRSLIENADERTRSVGRRVFRGLQGEYWDDFFERFRELQGEYWGDDSERSGDNV